jgi:hypothetical protein
MRNQHKGLERRWFEQCAYFCTCHSPGRLRTSAGCIKAIALLADPAFPISGVLFAGPLTFSSVDLTQKIALQRFWRV